MMLQMSLNQTSLEYLQMAKLISKRVNWKMFEKETLEISFLFVFTFGPNLENVSNKKLKQTYFFEND